MSEKLCIVMPVYNEQEAIGPVLEKWASALDALNIDYSIRPYNDGSKDNSLSVMREVAKGLPHVDVHDKPNGGHGNTILTGYRGATADGFDWIFQIDSDDEMGPEKFGELWEKRGDYDFLVGIRDGRIQQLPRKVISFVSRLCVRVFYGKSVWDVNTPYRLMRTSAFDNFYQAIPLTTFAPNVILSGLAARHKLRCYEIRVPQHDRTTGEVSIKKWKLLKAAAKSFYQTIRFSFSDVSLVTLGVCALAVIAGSFAFSSNPFTQYAPTDSSVFMYVGEGIARGVVPYRDVFDHKGPLIYFINYLGCSLGLGDAPGMIGVWLCELLFYWLCLVFIYKLVRSIFPTNIGLVACAALLFSMFLTKLSGGGNCVESYAALFCLVPYFFVMRAAREERDLTLMECFLSGVCGMGTLLLRPNMAVAGVPVGLFLIVTVLLTRNVKRFMMLTIAALMGLCLMLFPFILYYHSKGALADLWECYWSFNVSYLGRGSSNVQNLMLPIVFIVINVVEIVVLWRSKRDRVVLLWNALYLTTAFVLLALKPNYWHYYIPASIGFVLPILFIALKSRMVKYITLTCGFACLLVTDLESNFDLKGLIRAIREERSVRFGDFREGHLDDQIFAFRNKLKGKSSIGVIGNACMIYFKTGLRSNMRFPYQSPLVDISKAACRQVKSDLMAGVDEWLIVQDRAYSNVLKDEIERYYQKVLRTEDYSLWSFRKSRSEK